MNQILRRFSKFRLAHDIAFYGAVENIFEICAAKAQAPAVFFVPALRLFPFSDARARGQDRAALPESVPACSGAQNCVRRERISLPVMNSVSSSSGSVRFRFAGSSKIRVLRFLRDQPEKKRRPAGRRCPWQGSCPAAFCLRTHPPRPPGRPQMAFHMFSGIVRIPGALPHAPGPKEHAQASCLLLRIHNAESQCLAQLRIYVPSVCEEKGPLLDMTRVDVDDILCGRSCPVL